MGVFVFSSVTPLPEEFELQGFLALRPALRYTLTYYVTSLHTYVHKLLMSSSAGSGQVELQRPLLDGKEKYCSSDISCSRHAKTDTMTLLSTCTIC